MHIWGINTFDPYCRRMKGCLELSTNVKSGTQKKITGDKMLCLEVLRKIHFMDIIIIECTVLEREQVSLSSKQPKGEKLKANNISDSETMGLNLLGKLCILDIVFFESCLRS